MGMGDLVRLVERVGGLLLHVVSFFPKRNGGMDSMETIKKKTTKTTTTTTCVNTQWKVKGQVEGKQRWKRKMKDLMLANPIHRGRGGIDFHVIQRMN